MTTRPKLPLDQFDEASRPLVEAIRSDRPSAREVAIREISDVVDDALARELLRFAAEPEIPEEERGAALIALGPALQLCWEDEEADGSLPAAPPDADAFDAAFFEHPLSNEGYREVQEALRLLYHDAEVPKLLRRRALEAAVRAPRPWQADATAAAWSSDDPEWRLTAVFAMGHLGGLTDESFDEELREALSGRDEVIRREGMLAAGRSAFEEVAPMLMDLAVRTDADPEDRLTAIQALGEMAFEDARETLEALLDDPDPEIAMTAEEALEDISLFGGPDLDDDPGDDEDDLPVF